MKMMIEGNGAEIIHKSTPCVFFCNVLCVHKIHYDNIPIETPLFLQKEQQKPTILYILFRYHRYVYRIQSMYPGLSPRGVCVVIRRIDPYCDMVP